MEDWIVVVDDDAANLKMASGVFREAGIRGSYFKSCEHYFFIFCMTAADIRPPPCRIFSLAEHSFSVLFIFHRNTV